MIEKASVTYRMVLDGEKEVVIQVLEEMIMEKILRDHQNDKG